MRMEKSIEKAFTERILKWARLEGLELECLKFAVPGRMGYPDRFLMWGPPFGTMFIEFKQPNEKPEPLQSFIHDSMRAMGAEVQVHDNVDVALEAAKGYIKSTLRTDPGHEADRSQQGGQAVPAPRQGQDGYCAEEFRGSEKARYGGLPAGAGATEGSDD